MSGPDMNELLAAKVKFGLRAQGHFPIIEKMIAENRSWEEIGKAIGWDGNTAKEYWNREANAPNTFWPRT